MGRAFEHAKKKTNFLKPKTQQHRTEKKAKFF